MAIIDFHTHIFPDKVAEKAIPRMEETSGCKAFTDGTAAGLLSSMDRAGIEKSLVLPVATNPEKVSSVNRFSVSVNEPRLLFYGALHPWAPNWPDHLDEILGFGMTGVKLHPEYQDFDPDDPKLLPFFSALRDAGLLVVFHAGEDLSFHPPRHGSPRQISRLLDSVPGLQVMACHMGGWKMWDEAEQFLISRTVYLETSFSFGYIPHERIRSMIAQHGSEYIFFGTDSPWADQAAEVNNVLALGLGSASEEKIFYGNAVGLIPSMAD